MIQCLARVVRTLLVCVALAGVAGAQAPTTFPSTPGAVATPGPQDAGFRQWLAERATWESNRRPRLFVRGDLGVVVQTNAETYTPETTGRVLRALTLCRADLGLLEDEIQHHASARPWAAFDSAVRQPAVVLTILPSEPDRLTECGDDLLARLAFSEAGLSLASTLRESATLTSAAVRVDGRRVEPLLVARTELTTFSPQRLVQRNRAQLRIYLPLDAIAPRPDGSMPDLLIEVWNDGGGEAQPLAVPDNALREIARYGLRWRSVRAVTDSPRWLEHPAPRTPLLRSALARRADGDARGATALALDAIDSGLVRRPRELRTAYLLVAEQLAASGDTAGTRIAAAEVHRVAPCLRIPAETESALAPFLRRDPLPDECTIPTTREIYLRSAYLPGLGHVRSQTSSNRRTAGWIFMGATAIAFADGLRLKAIGEDRYSQYQNAQTTVLAETYYGQAESKRDAANARFTQGVLIWALTYAEHVLSERRRSRELALERSYGMPRRPELSFRAPPNGGLGIGLAIAP